MKIRRGAPADAHALAALADRTWPRENHSPAQIVRALTSEGHCCHVVEIDGKPAGFISAFPTEPAGSPPRWELDLLAVAPAYRRRGAGSALIQASLARAGRRPARALTGVDNRPVQRLLNRAGFTVAPAILALCIAPGLPPPNLHLPGGALAIPVTTFTYGGVWIEGTVTQEALRALVPLLQPAPGAITGTLLPVDAGLLSTALAVGLQDMGRYRWWWRMNAGSLPQAP